MLAVYMRSRVKRMERVQKMQPANADSAAARPRYVSREAFFSMKTLEHPYGKKINRVKLA